MAIKDTDKGYKALVERMTEASKGAKVRAGIHEADGSITHVGEKAVTTVLDVAQVHEFGTDRIPQRSFVRAWMDAHYSDVGQLAYKLMQAQMQGKQTLPQALGKIGSYMAGGMKARIAQGIPPPLAASTIARKGSSVPLIDTGQLRASITYSIVWAK